ncbi:MAG: hypothetical protein K5923_00640 [Clostridia bacterium]|nr:hypothetical protein [Clostridia bacterium]
MRKGKIIATILVAIALIATLVIGLIGCVDGNGGDTPTTTTTTTTTKKTRTTTTDSTTTPIIPTRPTVNPTNGGPTDPSKPGESVTDYDQYLTIAELLAGTVPEDGEGKYRILNMYIDIQKDPISVTNGQVTFGSKKRIIFRSNVEVSPNGAIGDNTYVLKMLDMTNAVRPQEDPDDQSSGDEEGDDSDPLSSLLSFQDDEGTVEAGASVTIGDIEKEQIYESTGTVEWAFYVIDGKLYLDKADGTPVLYFEDFDMDYVNAIASNLLDGLSDGEYDGQVNGSLFKLIDSKIAEGGMDLTINSILSLAKTIILPNMATKRIVVDDDLNVLNEYKLEIPVNQLIRDLKDLVGFVMGLVGGGLPFELQLDPLMEFLNKVTPEMKIYLVGSVYNGVTQSIGLDVFDNEGDTTTNPMYGELMFDLDIYKSILFSDSKIDLVIPDNVKNATKYESFSLTNIAFSLDLILSTDGSLDVGSVINSLLGKTTLPEETIIVDAATGFRIQLALDADLNYGKKTYIDENGKEQLVDNNYILLEIFLLGTNGALVPNEDGETEPLIAIYYRDGSLYANIGNLLKRYYSGSNIKVNLEGIPELIQYVVDLVTGALDNVFVDTLGWGDWVTWNELWNSKYNATDSTDTTTNSLSTAEESSEIVSVSDINCVSLATDEYGNYRVSTDFVTFLKAVGYVVGLGDIFSINDEHTAIVITANTILMNGIKALASSINFDLPDGLLAEISINFANNGDIDYIRIAASLDSRSGYCDADGNWYLGTKLLFKDVLFTADGDTCYYDAALTKKFTFTADHPKDNYDFIYVKDGKFYLDKECKNETEVGYNSSGAPSAYKRDLSLGVNSSALDSDQKPESAKISAYVINKPVKENGSYKDNYIWVVGYGLDEGKYVEPETEVKAKGLGLQIKIHELLFCYTTEHLDRFDTSKGGKSYKGYYGAKSNIEGYILSKTHHREVAKVTSTSTGSYYTYDSILKEYTVVELGTGEGQTPYSPDETYYTIVENDYVSSVSQWINTLLEGSFLSINLLVEFSEGKYNLAPILSLFLPEMADKQLIWEFTGDVLMDVSLNIGISLNKADPTKSMVVLEIVANKDIVIKQSKDGTVPEKVMFEGGESIIGVYGKGNKIYAELSNLKLLNITLPNLSLELDYTTLLFDLIGEKEIFDLTFDLYDLIFNSKEEESTSNTSNTSNGELSTTGEEITTENIAAQFDTSIADALALYIDSDVVAVALTVGGLQKLLASFNVNLGLDLTTIMDLAIDLVLNRKKGVYLDITGALLPKYDEEQGENYFDDDLLISLRLATDAEDLVYDSETGKLISGRVASPVQIGSVDKLLKNYERKFEKLESQTDQYYDDVIAALLKVIGDVSLTITIDASVLNSVWDINKIIDTIVADRADSFAVPINILFDEWETEVQLVVQWYLDLNNFKNTQIRVEIRYEGRVWIGLYVYNNSIVLDLNGIGLFDVEISNLKLIASLGEVISSLMANIGDLSLTSLIGGLIDDAMNPGSNTSNASETEETSTTEGEVSTTEGETSEATDETSNDGGALEIDNKTKASNDLLSLLLASISIKNTTVAAHLTADVFEAIFRELLGFSMYLEFDIGLEVDIQEGRLGLSVGVERSVFADITLELAAGERGAFKFYKDLDAVPDWNAINGTYLAKTLFKNLDIGLYVDIDNNTSTSGSAQYTRLYIEKLKKTTTLANTDNLTASKDSILVTIASIDETEFNNAGKGTKTPLIYAELNYNTSNLNLALCKGLISVVGIDIGSRIGAISISLAKDITDDDGNKIGEKSLLDQLGETFDGLLGTINGLLGSLIGTADEDLNEVVDAVTGDTDTQEEEEEVDPDAGLPVAKATQIASTYEWDTRGSNIKNVNNAGKYYEYFADGDMKKLSVDGNTRYTTEYLGSFYRIEDDGTAKALSLEEISSVDQIPEASAEIKNTVFYIKHVDTSVFTEKDGDNEVEITKITTTYSFYACRNVTRRTYEIVKLETQSGLSGFFGDLDIISLFDMIDVYLSCDKTSGVGVLNADVSINTYMINYLIDNLLYYILGPETILDLSAMDVSKGQGFSDNYLSKIHWNRVDANALWNELYDQVPGLLSDVLRLLVNVDLSSGLISAAAGLVGLENQVKSLIQRFLPFAVTNESHLGLNIVRGQLTNIYFTNQDKNEAVVDADGNPYTFLNGTKEVTYTANSRSSNYFTNLHIFNTSPSVGDEQYTGYDGAVTWDSTPTTITYNPYMHTSDADAAEDYYKQYFGSGHTATYQKATALYKADITFKYEGTDTVVDADTLNAKLATAQTFYIVATAPFNNGAETKTLRIKFVVQGGPSTAAITKIDEQDLFVYQDMPAYIFIYTADGISRRVETSSLQFASTQDGSTPDLDNDGNWTIKHDFNYVNLASEDGGWDQTILVKFPNGTVAPMTINYKNSTITNVIVEGATNNTIKVDLYQFDETSTLAKYTPDEIYFTYSDGTAGKIKVDKWDTEEGSNINELFERVTGTTHSVAGAQYKLYATVAKGTQNEQVIELTFDVPSRKVTSVSFGTRTNMLEVQPYEYYLYMTDNTKYAKYNPYQSKVMVNYDTYSEMVSVVWSNIATVTYNWDIDKTEISQADVKLDPNAYPSGDIFTWTQKVDVSVSRNQIQGIYFDADLTQTTLTIDPYAFHNVVDPYDYYPTTAYVQFTNGKVLEMPVAWLRSEVENFNVDYTTDYTQFTAVIGFDVEKYEVDRTVEGYKLNPTDQTSPFYQEYTINVKVDGTAIKGIALEGSEYMGGTYKVDPIKVDYLGTSAFPSTVSVVYDTNLANSLGQMNVIKWMIQDENEDWVAIDLSTYKVGVEQKVGLVARCYLTNDLYFTINYEILDRSASMMTVDTSAITAAGAINPYSYRIKDDGTITYNIFEDTMDVSYATSFTITLSAAGIDGTFGTADDIVKYTKVVTSTTDLNAAKKAIRSQYRYSSADGTYLYEGEACKLNVATEYTTYSLPVYWDTSRLNLTREGSTETVYFYFGKGTDYEIVQYVDVEFAPKTIHRVEADDYIFEVYVDETSKPTTLTPKEYAAQMATRTLLVYFADGTSDYMDVTIDFTTAKDENGTLFGVNAFSNKTRYTFTATPVDETAQEYYVLGRYNPVKLRGNGTNYDANAIYYTFTEIETEDLQANTEYFIFTNNTYVPVKIDSGKTNVGSYEYYVRTVASVTAETEGTFYTLNDTASDRNAYVPITTSTAAANYYADITYYTLAISSYYTVEASIGTISPALTQTVTITMYVLD